MEFFATVSGAFHQGGVWMYAILITQIASFAIIIERVYSLFVLHKPSQKSVAANLEHSLRSGEFEKVLLTVRNLPKSDVLGPVVEAGAQAAMDFGGRDQIRAKMDEVLLEENSLIEKRIHFLATIGNVATLLGLLGTVIGMITSFSSVTSADPLEKAAILSRGISLAMHSTAYGLLVAIPALVMYSILQNRANNLIDDLNQSALKVFNWLSYNFENVTRRRLRST